MKREKDEDSLKPITNLRKKPAAWMSATALVVGFGLWFAFDIAGEGIRISSPEELHSYFEEEGYTQQALHTPDSKVPPVIFTSIPKGWAEGLDVAAKKSLFFRSLLPLLLKANGEIATERSRLLELQAERANNRTPGAKDRKWLRQLATRYGVIDPGEANDSRDVTAAEIARLVRRVDAVPPSLALVQGAIESAYASSRFAVEGNALFGQWRLGSGLRPEKQRTNLGDYRVADFDSPLESVRAYMLNLNTNAAYKPFRDLRASARKSGRPLSGKELAGGLTAYSERGEAYVEEVREIIRSNGLGPTDTARLRDQPEIDLRPGLF